jgi:CheY-like chemotaxis protein
MAALHDVVATPPDLLLSDVVMPGLSGPSLVAKVRERGVDVPVVYMSGYPRQDDGDEPLDGPLLGKPFTVDGLRKAMANALAPRVKG